MKFKAKINIMPREELLDPQGKAVELGLRNLAIGQLTDIRIGKHITLQIEADTEAAAKEMLETACQRLLANPIMEHYSYEIEESTTENVLAKN